MTTKNSNQNDVGSTTGMSLERFAALVEAYGGDLDRWPEAERFAAISFAGRSEEARTLLSDAHGLDFLLSRLDAPPVPSAALRERVAELGPEAGRTLPPDSEMSGSIDRIGVSASSMAGTGLFSAMRSNALMLSVVLNVVLASAVGGLWIVPRSAPGPVSEVAYGYADFEETLPDELGAERGLGDELETPSPVDRNFADFDEESSDDFEVVWWPDAEGPSVDEISSI